MQNQIDTLLADIKKDYENWTTQNGKREISSYSQGVLDNFYDNVQVKQGKKYIKIIRENSVWGFIVATDNHPKFRKGDILKAAGWNAPAMNAPRGNILDGGYTVRWTGPLYLN
tara:strand:- start:25979 stop:26317 length:339 start_codon:yes stop_codon:yes gene_type:complete